MYNDKADYCMIQSIASCICFLAVLKSSIVFMLYKPHSRVLFDVVIIAFYFEICQLYHCPPFDVLIETIKCIVYEDEVIKCYDIYRVSFYLCPVKFDTNVIMYDYLYLHKWNDNYCDILSTREYWLHIQIVYIDLLC